MPKVIEVWQAREFAYSFDEVSMRIHDADNVVGMPKIREVIAPDLDKQIPGWYEYRVQIERGCGGQ